MGIYHTHRLKLVSLFGPIDENGHFAMEFTELEENLVIMMEANCGENVTTTDKVTIQYIVEKSDENSS